MSNPHIHLVGFGSQGSAWADCLRKSGWTVHVYVPANGKSFEKAIESGFSPRSIEFLTEELAQTTEIQWIAMLCPDPMISTIYRDYLINSPASIRLILAHGYAVYSGELKLKGPHHRALLLAPKAIGPKLRQNFLETFPQPHKLIAAFSATHDDQEILCQIAAGLGFQTQSLVRASFEEECIGDLMSEQGLLCGGIFNLLEWTIEAMHRAGVPTDLIREECLTELELIAGMIREKGPATTFQSISQVAQCGTIALGQHLETSGFKSKFLAQMESIQNKSFPEYFRSIGWKDRHQNLQKRLAYWESLFKKGAS